jgi:hypothetical protein
MSLQRRCTLCCALLIFSFSPICGRMLVSVAETLRNVTERPFPETQVLECWLWLLKYVVIFSSILFECEYTSGGWLWRLCYVYNCIQAFVYILNVTSLGTRALIRLGDCCLACVITCNAGNHFPQILLLFYRYVNKESCGATALNKIYKIGSFLQGNTSSKESQYSELIRHTHLFLCVCVRFFVNEAYVCISHL